MLDLKDLARQWADSTGELQGYDPNQSFARGAGDANDAGRTGCKPVSGRDKGDRAPPAALGGRLWHNRPPASPHGGGIVTQLVILQIFVPSNPALSACPAILAEEGCVKRCWPGSCRTRALASYKYYKKL